MVQSSRSLGEIPRHRVGGIVLAGTYHWTGSSFEGLRARPLLPVALSPIITHVLKWLDDASVPGTTICANGSTSALRRYLDQAHGLELSVGYHEDGTPRGAAGCVKDAAEQSAADTFIVTDGASIPTADVDGLLRHHFETEADLTIVAHRRMLPHSSSPDYRPTGTYVFSRAVLDAIPATTFHDIKENLIPKLYRERRRIELFEVADMSPRVLNAETYMALNRWMLHRMTAPTGGPVVHPSARIDEGAVIMGPVVVGDGVRIHSSSTIVGPSVIGAGSTVRPGATVTRSITWDDCHVGENAFVDQCVVAEAARVESGETISGVLRVDVPSRHRMFERPRRDALGSTRAVAGAALS